MTFYNNMNSHQPYYRNDNTLRGQNVTFDGLQIMDIVPERYQDDDASIPSWLDQEEAFLDNALNCQPDLPGRVSNPLGYLTNDRPWQASPYVLNQARTHNEFSVGSTRLRSTSELGAPYKNIFRYEFFNAMQSACLDDAFYSDSNLLVSAPTGSGKTAVMEMTILRALSIFGGDAKIIYMAPIKSLCSERAADWEQKFQNLGVTCKEFTGDSDFITADAIKKTNIIVTTPEKWDSMTRRWKDNRSMMQLIKLFMIDEVHILNDTRGAVLEACVSRMKTVGQHMRYVAVSATVPNVQDVADWLHAKALLFSDEFRPVQLEKHVYGIPFSGDNMFAFEKKLDWKLLEMIEKHSKNKPVLIFCSTRKSAQSSCEAIIKAMEQRGKSTLGAATPQQMSVKDRKLREFIPKGLAFHHAGLDPEDRRAVEQLFLNRAIRVVATTSTLALGVNLPAYLIIIKSTKVYQGGAMVDYSDIDMLQMIGRAGRPGLEDSACAVILTTQSMEHKYNNLVSGSREIESSLHLSLVEHLMTEICLGTIVDISSSIKWLRSTFLYVRIKKNPLFYQTTDIASSSSSPDIILEEICKKSIELLVEEGFVQRTNDPQHGAARVTYQATDFGTAMDRYCIKVGTMSAIMKMDHCSSARDMLELVSHAEEFATVRFAAGEKPFLNSLQKNPNIRFPLTEKVTCVADKVFLVLQCVLGDISLHNSPLGSSLALESFQILQHATRITKCIIDCAICERNATKLKHALDLHRSLKARMWSTSMCVLRQLDRIGPQMAQKLSQAGVSTIEQLRATDARRIEVILRRNPPFGNQILDAVNNIPQFQLQVQQSRSSRNGAEVILKISASVTNTKKFREQKFGKGNFAQIWTETSDHTLLDFRRIIVKKLQERCQSFTLSVAVTSPSMRILCHLQSEDYVGINVMQEIVPDVDYAVFAASHEEALQSMPETTSAGQEKNEIAEPRTTAERAFMDVDDMWPIEDDLDEEMLVNLPDAQDFESVIPKTSTSKAKTAKECKHHCKNKVTCKHACCKIRDTSQWGQKRLSPFSQTKLQLESARKRVRTTSTTIAEERSEETEIDQALEGGTIRDVMDQLATATHQESTSPERSSWREPIGLTGHDEFADIDLLLLDDNIFALADDNLDALSLNRECQKAANASATELNHGPNGEDVEHFFDDSSTYYVEENESKLDRSACEDQMDPCKDIWDAVGDYAYHAFNKASKYVLQELYQPIEEEGSETISTDKLNETYYAAKDDKEDSIAKWLELNTCIID